MKLDFSKIFRLVIFLVFLLIQILVFWTIIRFFDQKLYVVIEIIGFLVALVILSSSKKTVYKLSWLVFLVVLPVTGTLFYLLFGDIRFIKKIHQIEEDVIHDNNLINIQNEEVIEEIKDMQTLNHANNMYDLGNFPVYNNTYTKYFKVGEDYFAAMKEDLKNAKKYIFIEIYIISEGKLYEQIKEILIQKAKEGIEIYFIYDFFGSLKYFSYQMTKDLKKYGINVKPFNANILRFYNFINYRTHRKLTIIDGNICYTGGLNIADEYINEKNLYGHWKDTGIKYEGKAANTFVKAFILTWTILNKKKEPLNVENYLYNKKDDKSTNIGISTIIPFTESPTNVNNLAQFNYMKIISNAKKYVYITTPYFIIDGEMLAVLKLSALSGVKIKIIIPGIPDKELVYQITKAHLKELLDAGIEVYKYDSGFIHSKMIISDDRVTTIGSINFDYRSLLWNYECGVIVYDKQFTKNVKADFENTLIVSSKMSYKSILIFGSKIIDKFFRGLIKVISPLI